ncbi:hypothetical protein L596_001722 [Steinernema carpocapsae]|uniref:Uncharacterized protein n=1 Tax=Steinernema carpocapsae TaxID=34508 RepID=A0A4U8UQZ0_STECR|nr:hypothetical protein L596_001722 [Steinernema carpocapsae]
MKLPEPEEEPQPEPDTFGIKSDNVSCIPAKAHGEELQNSIAHLLIPWDYETLRLPQFLSRGSRRLYRLTPTRPRRSLCHCLRYVPDIDDFQLCFPNMDLMTPSSLCNYVRTLMKLYNRMTHAFYPNKSPRPRYKLVQITPSESERPTSSSEERVDVKYFAIRTLRKFKNVKVYTRLDGHMD